MAHRLDRSAVGRTLVRVAPLALAPAAIAGVHALAGISAAGLGAAVAALLLGVAAAARLGRREEGR
jgi:hypothetical protein